MPDITKKYPDKKEKNFKNSLLDFLFYLVQWTWGLPVNLVGGIAFLVHLHDAHPIVPVKGHGNGPG